MAADTEPLLNAILDSRQPATALLKKLGENAGAAYGTHNRLMKRRREQLYGDASINTSFGTLIQDLDVVNEDEETVTLSIIHPFALLEWLCIVHYCMTRAQDGCMKFLLYEDGVTPGNNA